MAGIVSIQQNRPITVNQQTVVGGEGGDRYRTSSISAVTIVPNGTVTFEVDSGLAYTPLQDITAYHDTSNFMSGEVVSYSGTTLVMDVRHKTGSGTHSSWTINLDGVPISAITGATDSTLTVTGTTIGLNLSNQNVWAATQTFSQNPILSAMTPGSVPFFGASGLMSQDNQNLFWHSGTKQLDVYGSLGAEKVTNGTFTGSATGWTVGSGWAYASNAVSKTSNGTAVLSQSGIFVNGEEYVVSVTVSNLTVGTVTPTLSTSQQDAISANGTYTYRVVAGGNSAISFTPSNTARLTVDNVSVRLLSGGSVRTGQLNPFASHSNSTPGTTCMERFDNSGGNTWTEYRFSGALRAAIGADSSGNVNLYASGGNHFAFYTGNSGLSSNQLTAYLYPTAFVHTSGFGAFANGVHAGAQSSPSSTLQTAGSFAAKVARKTANFTAGTEATVYLVDPSAAACSGTPSTPCSSYTNESDCLARDAHGGCSWFAGNPCSAFNGDQSSCEGQSGCTYETASCSSFGDESTCNSYSGCSFDSSTCAGYSNATDCGNDARCTTSTSDCSTFSDGGGDGSACGAYPECSYDSGTGACSGSYFTGCSGSFCAGSYYTGSCTGTYGAACSGTAACAGIDDSTSCGAESGCTWATAVTATLPAVSTCPDRQYTFYNLSSANADVIVVPTGTDQINHTTSYVLGSYKDFVTVTPFRDARGCSELSEGACSGQAGCTANYPNCAWNSGENTCSGGTGCSGYGDQSSCEAATYYNGCSGTYVASSGWYVIGR